MNKWFYTVTLATGVFCLAPAAATAGELCSFFQHPLYPFSGGTPLGTNMINLPIPAYSRGGAVRELIEMMWMPRLEEFAPQMVFISAGFDAHREDDLGQLGLVERKVSTAPEAGTCPRW